MISTWNIHQAKQAAREARAWIAAHEPGVDEFLAWRDLVDTLELRAEMLDDYRLRDYRTMREWLALHEPGEPIDAGWWDWHMALAAIEGAIRLVDERPVWAVRTQETHDEITRATTTAAEAGAGQANRVSTGDDVRG